MLSLSKHDRAQSFRIMLRLTMTSGFSYFSSMPRLKRLLFLALTRVDIKQDWC